MLTKRDYVAIASILNDARKEGDTSETTQLSYTRYLLAKYFKEENPRFDVSRFLDACLKEE